MHFCFLPLEGVKLFPTASFQQAAPLQHRSTECTTALCRQMKFCHAKVSPSSGLLKGLLFRRYPSEVLQGLLMFHLFDGRSDSQCFQSLCPVVSLARATRQTNIIVSVASRNVNCGIFSKHPVSVSGYVHAMIYGSGIMGCNVMWSQCQWERERG